MKFFIPFIVLAMAILICGAFAKNAEIIDNPDINADGVEKIQINPDGIQARACYPAACGRSCGWRGWPYAACIGGRCYCLR